MKTFRVLYNISQTALEAALEGSHVRPAFKASGLSPACACHVAQQATIHGQTKLCASWRVRRWLWVTAQSSWHYKGWCQHLGLRGSTAWSDQSKLLLAAGRGGHCSDWFAWCKDTYLPFSVAMWHVLHLGFIPVPWAWDLNVLTSTDTSIRTLKMSQIEISSAALAVDDYASQQWWLDKKNLIPIEFNAQSRNWKKKSTFWYAKAEFV